IGFASATTSVPPAGVSSSAAISFGARRSISARNADARWYSPRRFATVAPSVSRRASAGEPAEACAISMPRSTQRRVSSIRRDCPVERAPLPPRERTVEDVPDHPARERERVAARLALLDEETLADEALDGVLQVFLLVRLRERLEVAELEALPEDGSEGEDLL